jgi:HNH endonuclease
MAALIAEKILNNDGAFFKSFTRGREKIEGFLVENKSLVAKFTQNMNRTQRVPKMRDFFQFLVSRSSAGIDVKPEHVVSHLGLRGPFLEVVEPQGSPRFSDDVKSIAFMRETIRTAMKCPICNGLLDPNKSISYDHKIRVSDGGSSDVENAQLVHPYCNTSIKS